MTAKTSNQFAVSQKTFSFRSALGSALGVAVLGTSFFLGVGVNKSHARIIQSATEDINEVGREYGGAKGGTACNHMQNVTTFMGNTAYPVRGGNHAFQHVVDRCGERSELRGETTEIGKTYWYGWSVFIPSDWTDQDPGFDIFSQWAIAPNAPNRQLACGANGSTLSRTGNNLSFKFQHKGEKADSECSYHVIGKVSELRGKWVDLVMNAKWTGNKDGFLKLWAKIGNGEYTQKVNYVGRTFWNDEGNGPYFKMGLYKGDPNWKGSSSRTAYTDEYRLGNDKSSFEEVAPR